MCSILSILFLELIYSLAIPLNRAGKHTLFTHLSHKYQLPSAVYTGFCLHSLSEETTAPPPLHSLWGSRKAVSSDYQLPGQFGILSPQLDNCCRNGRLTQTKLISPPRAFVRTVRKRQPLISGLGNRELLVSLIASPRRKSAWESSQHRGRQS